MLLLLNDAADPGFPSFPVLRVDRHLQLFISLPPPCFLNQGESLPLTERLLAEPAARVAQTQLTMYYVCSTVVVCQWQ